ncbi:MAG: hypothetical protein K5659_05095 [Lachnospiraceae bacterium]|nr:hypothetical protein [Lachnospiraceae bacterium]
MIVVILGVTAIVFFWLINLYFSSVWDKKLSISLDVDKSIVSEGDTLVLTETITNDKMMVIPSIEIKYNVPASFQFADNQSVSTGDNAYRKDNFALLGKKRISRTYAFKASKRGYYHLTGFDVVARDYLAKKKYIRRAANESELCVLPKPTDCGDFIPLYDVIRKNAEYKNINIILDGNTVINRSRAELQEHLISIVSSIGNMILTEGYGLSVYSNYKLNNDMYLSLHGLKGLGELEKLNKCLASINTSSDTRAITETVEKSVNPEDKETATILISANRLETIEKFKADMLKKNIELYTALIYTKYEVKNILKDKEASEDERILLWEVDA